MSGRAAVERWRTAAEVLAEVRREPGLTRVELARRLRLASASATEISTRLRELGWVDEQRAPTAGRGRPTTVLSPAAHGPAVLAVDLRFEDWRCALAGLDGRLLAVRTGRYRRRDPDAVRDELRAVASGLVAGAPGPVTAAGVAVAETLVGGRPSRLSDRQWLPVEPARVADVVDGPVVVGNDATLAGVAEVRTGAAIGAATALFLTVEVGIGGALVVDGRPQSGAGGAAGEFGHLPFGEPDRACVCGARGCWTTGLGGDVLARLLGEPEPADPYSYTEAVLARARAGAPGGDRAARSGSPGADRAARDAAGTVAARLGRGTAGLVNAHDPDVVVLGGLGPGLRSVAGPEFDDAYAAGLMSVHRTAPPRVCDAVHGTDASLHGAAAVALDEATSAAGLARLAASGSAPGSPSGSAPEAEPAESRHEVS